MDKLNWHPTIFIIIAGFFWGVEGLFSFPKGMQVNAEYAVFYEYILGILCLLPFAWKRFGKDLFVFHKKEWLLIMTLGLVGSGLAKLFYTLSLNEISAETFTLIQMVQPFWVLMIAFYFLKEKNQSSYLPWGFWVLISAILIDYPNFETGQFLDQLENHSQGFLLALSCMLIWGSATVLGKKLLNNHHPTKVVFWRWVFACLFLGVIAFKNGEVIPLATMTDFSFIWRFILMGAFGGFIAMRVYYQGLSNLPAGFTSFLELSYPIFGVVFISLYRFGKLEMVQMVGTISMVLALFILVKMKDAKFLG